MSEDRPTSGPAHEADDKMGVPPLEPNQVEQGKATDADAWATACAEDLAAEKARRRAQYGPPPGSAAEELKKFVDAVADKLSGLQSPLFGAVAQGTAQQMVNQVVRQAKAAVEPVIERNPDVFDHLAAAGSELLAAYRSAVAAQERRWTTARDQDRGPGESGTGRGEHIDLD
ncbi:DUF5304 domain-containing protein [Streptomyces cavernae]|uniref:DUF5304 domain-containing protein n=1 Tax=Streptomyces cavernae TaxID=2259034 RepID=UPI001391C596|nr:DUF5304 domain-containing protein [Streptomyces cavernae]